MKRRFLVLFFLLSGALTPFGAALGDWRDITPEEEHFVQLVEKRTYAVLRNAAQNMGSRWKIVDLGTNNFQRKAVDGANHKGRPHEVRVELHMEYQPADDAELGVLDGEIDQFSQRVARMEKVPDALARTNPSHKKELYTVLIVNYMGFMPLSIKAAASLGDIAQYPGTVFSYVQWKGIGESAPKRTLLMGEFRRGPHSGEERIFETFADTPDCRNVRTIILNVQSNETISDQFVKALDLQDLNALIAKH